MMTSSVITHHDDGGSDWHPVDASQQTGGTDGGYDSRIDPVPVL